MTPREALIAMFRRDIHTAKYNEIVAGKAADDILACLRGAGHKVLARDATQAMANAGWSAIANTAEDPQGAAWPIWRAMWDAAE